MSSSNLVSITYTDEAQYGQAPDPATGPLLSTARFVSESLSGTPTTTESGAVRVDRMSGGQVVTGLEVGGSLDFELARDPFFDQFFAMGMMSLWGNERAITAGGTFTPDPTDPQQGTITGTDIGVDIKVGDVIKMIAPSGPTVIDPAYFSVIAVVSDDELTVACKRDQGQYDGGVMRPEYVDIGADIMSVLMSKAYKDVTHLATTDEHGQAYSGMIVSGFSVSATYGQIVTGSYNMSGNGYNQLTPSYEQQAVTGGGVVSPAGSSQPINASIDVPLVTAEGEATTFCIESFNINLDNGLTPQNCIGHAAPRKYELGTAAITIDASIYLGDQSYDKFMPAKLSQAPVSLMFTMVSNDGGYAFVLPAVQLSFPDPSAGGANTPVMIDASGTAKVGPNGESALRIYRL